MTAVSESEAASKVIPTSTGNHLPSSPYSSGTYGVMPGSANGHRRAQNRQFPRLSMNCLTCPRAETTGATDSARPQIALNLTNCSPIVTIQTTIPDAHLNRPHRPGSFVAYAVRPFASACQGNTLSRASTVRSGWKSEQAAAAGACRNRQI